MDEMGRKRKWRGRRRRVGGELTLSSTEEEKKMEVWTDRGLTVFSWKSKWCGYQPRVRIWGEIFI